MNFQAMFTEAFQVSYNVESLAAYKLQRAREFPGVPVKHFTNWYEHRKWMLSEREKQKRIRLNRIIQENYKEEHKGS